MRSSSAAKTRRKRTSKRTSEPREAPEDVLKKHGLKLKDSIFVLEGEAEAREKATEMRRLQNELKIALKQQQATVSPEARQQTIQLSHR